MEVVEGKALVSPWKWDDRSMYFHATWRQLTKVPSFREGTTKPEEGAFDVNFVEVAGQGVYVGDTLTVFNGADAWWGEGDEKIFVDGEVFPSHIGTGTEDYFGYAWCRPEFFASPFHAQPTGAGNLTAGFSVNSRYRALDAIPFTKSVKFDMELWHWANTVVNYAPATFWYARPGATHNVAAGPRNRGQAGGSETLRCRGNDSGERCRRRRRYEETGNDGRHARETNGVAVPLEQRRTNVVEGCRSRRIAWSWSSPWRRRDVTRWLRT